MGNPHIIEKVLFTLIGMMLILVVWSSYEQITFHQKCEDAGGVRAASICINPAAVIEVN